VQLFNDLRFLRPLGIIFFGMFKVVLDHLAKIGISS